MDLEIDNAILYELIDEIMTHMRNMFVSISRIQKRRSNSAASRLQDKHPYELLSRIPSQVKHLNRMVDTTDSDCINNLRMDRNTFGRLCLLLHQLGGLKDGKFVSVEEQVALFVGVLAHHKKNRIVSFDFWRSGETVSRYVHIVLRAVLKLHGILLVKPEPVRDDCTDPRWKRFKGCLGALDGTYINVQVAAADKPRFRTRKGQIATNTLAVCDINLRFVYVLPGWEGSAGDSRVLRDAVNRVHGLKVPRGSYYLCDNGYANCDGFLTPYKNVRYHLKEWGPNSQMPQTPEEMFNMRHTKARNIIERAFGIMKMRWGIFKSASFYPIKIQIRIIMACFLLHNFIRSEMEVDPIEQGLGESNDDADDEHADANVHYVDGIESSVAWNQKRNGMALSMWAWHCRCGIMITEIMDSFILPFHFIS